MSRQTWILIALGSVAVAALLASIGAWVQLWRDHRARLHPDGSEPPDADAGG